MLEWAAVAAITAGATLYWWRRRAKTEGSPGPSALRPVEERGPLAVGDVLLVAGDELWLAGALELREVGTVATLFHAPGAKADWLARLDEEGRDLAILAASDRIEPGPVPEELRIEGHRLVLERRGAAALERRGEHLPTAASRARYAVLGSAAGRVAVVLDFDDGERLALVGRRVDPARIDRLGGQEPPKDRPSTSAPGGPDRRNASGASRSGPRA